MKIISVVGARPQFVKLAPISRAFSPDVDHVIVHTGQHYDHAMSGAFFDDLRISAPKHNLAIGSGAHGVQTGMMMASLEATFEVESPDGVLVYGDTNSTLAAALVAVKMHIPLIHLEAGLRSHNRRMPEEHNRVLTDHAADLLLAPTEVAVQHLEREGLAEKTRLVGDVMTDVLFLTRDEVLARPRSDNLPSAAFYLATIHRPDNTDNPERLSAIVRGLAEMDHLVVLVAHPRLVAAAQQHAVELNRPGIQLRSPMGYAELIQAVLASAGVLTDSGGLQKEAFLLSRPTVTLRSETEWPETISLGGNVLQNEDFSDLTQVIKTAEGYVGSQLPYGDGKAAHRATAAIESLIKNLHLS